MLPTPPRPSRTTAAARPRPASPRRPALSPPPQWQNLFLAPRYSDPRIQQEIDEEFDEGALPRRTHQR